MPLLDPPEPPEGGSSMRAKDLVNKVCLFRPTGFGEWPATDDKKAQPYVECDVWVLDRAGILEEGTGVRVGWWKAVEQLRGAIGQVVGAKPEQEQGSNAIHLLRLEGEARAVAAKVTAEIEAQSPADDEGPW
jgi:hypothetical protein